MPFIPNKYTLSRYISIHSFKEEELEAFFKFGKIPGKKSWSKFRSVVQRKLDMLDYSHELEDLRSPPGNRLESLSRKLHGYYSIRINDQWRIVFKWDTQPYDVQIMDYH